MRVLAVFVIAFVALAAAKNVWSVPHKPSTRITNGNEAAPHSRPWQVGLFIPTWRGTIFCGGSLIDDQNVLTAAHCIDDVIGVIDVVLGAHNIEQREDTQVRLSTNFHANHPEYNSSSRLNDIGLVFLPSPVTFNENIQPIPLDNGSSSDDYTGQDANVSGWGHVSENATSNSPVLREVTVEVISNDECTSVYDSDLIQPTKICTDGSGGKSICAGDTGGALVLDGTQIGIVSFTPSEGCESGDPAAYTRVGPYSSWIEEYKQS